MAKVGISSNQSDTHLLLQGANVSNEILDLICFQAFAVRRHFPFAVADDPSDRIIALRLHIRGTKITNLVRFANGCISLPVRAVASRAS